ncbi:MAG: VIT domain-containing protein, partial [Verrucomicrobiota bacterium]
MKKIYAILMVVIWGWCAGVRADMDGEFQGESPYFEVSSAGGVDSLPLKSTEVDVQISGVIAEVTVTQRYTNTGKEKLEAVYIFPGSNRAAVHGLTIKLGDRELVAQVQEKEKARKTYEAAKAANKTAGLLEQHRPNVFQMNVANILPGDVIDVELRYTETLVPTERIYEFVFPTVVGPRYSQAGNANEEWSGNPYLQEGKANPVTFDIDVALSAGMPMNGVRCLSHETTVSYQGKDRAKVELKNPTDAGNRDYILEYRLADKKVNTGLILHEGGDDEENFFLLTVQPPERVESSEVLPREFVFLVDTSGSMQGFPSDVTAQLMRRLFDNLTPEDRFNLITFASGQRVFANQSRVPNRQTLADATKFLRDNNNGGSTELSAALERTYALPKQSENMSRIIVVITDGYISFERDVYDLIEKNLSQANLFAFGIGSSVNRYLIDGMARIGQGEPFVVTDRAAAGDMAEKLRLYLSQPVMTNLAVNFDGLDVYDIEPAVPADVFADRPITIAGKWRGKPEGKISVQGDTASGRETIDLVVEPDQLEEPALPRLWARERIARLDDYVGNRRGVDEDHKLGIVNLGLTYNLLTRYTSFVAVDDSPREEMDSVPPTTVNQALP